MILDHLEVDAVISEVGMETTGFSNYKEILEIDKIANNMLAIIYNRLLFSCKDK